MGTGDLTSGLLKMIGYYLGWGARAEGTARRRKNWRLKITFTNETTCNIYKTHILTLNLKISCENWIQHIIQSSSTSNTYISFLLKYVIEKKAVLISHASLKGSTIIAH